MRKITFGRTLFALALLLCGALPSGADTPDWARSKKISAVGESNNTGTSLTAGAYLIHANSDDYASYVTAPSATGGQLTTVSSVTAPTTDLSSVFYITPTTTDGTTTYTFQLANGDYVAQMTFSGYGGPIVTSATAGTFTISEMSGNEGYYTIKDTQNNYWWDINITGPVSWTSETTTTTGNGSYSFVPVTLKDADLISFTYKVMDASGNVLASQEASGEAGDALALPDGLKRDYCTYSELSVTTLAEGTTEAVSTVTYALPFTVSTDIASNWDGATWYTMKINRSTAKYSCYAPSTETATNTTDATVSRDKLFAFTGDPYNGFKIYNYMAGSSKVLWSASVSDNATIPFTETSSVTKGGDWQLVANGDYTVFKKYGATDGYINDVSSKLGYWQYSAAATDAGSSFTFTEVTLSEVTEMAAFTYKVVDSVGNTIATQKVVANVGTSSALPDDLKRDYCTYSDPTPSTIESSTTEVSSTVTYALPFTVSTDIASNWDSATWYTMKINRSTAKYCSYDEANDYVTNGTDATAATSKLFAFTGDPYNGFKIYNYIAGSSKVLWSASVSDNATIPFTETSSVTKGGDWQLVANGDYTVFKKYGATNGYMNDVGSKLGYWQYSAAATDAGSSFTFTETTLGDALIGDLLTVITNAEKYNTTTTDELNKYTEATSGTLSSALTTAKALTSSSSKTDIENAETALSNAISALTIVQPKDGSFIRVRATDGANSSMPYLLCDTVKTLSKALRAKLGDGGSANSVFYYKDGKLLGFGTGYYLANVSNQARYNGITDGASIAFTTAANGTAGCYNVNIAASSSSARYLYTSYGQDVDSTYVFYTDAGSNAAGSAGYNYWLENVTALPVTIGEKLSGYATFYTPVAVTIPEGVTVYTGAISSDGKYIDLTKQTGTIPAGSAVLLKGTAGTTYNFTISSDSEATQYESNIFAGSAASVETSTVTNPCVLWTNEDVVGFYNYVGKEITGFKAYIAGTNSTLGLRFPDGTTGIEGISSETNAPAAVYDLQGRRVNNATRGLYIIGGKKVLIK